MTERINLSQLREQIAHPPNMRHRNGKFEPTCLMCATVALIDTAEAATRLRETLTRYDHGD